jgi:hypothetical protein
MAAIFVEKQQTIHALAFSEDQVCINWRRRGNNRGGRHLSIAGEWDSLPTKAMLMVRQTMLDKPRCWPIVTATWRLP